MLQILAEYSSSYITVKKRAVEVKRGRVSKTSTTDEQVDAVHHTVQQIAKSISTSFRPVHIVSIEVLGMIKLSTR